MGFRDGTVAERLNVSTIRKLPIPVPTIAQQEEIIAQIVPLECKQSVNRKMNATLEAMAQALFKSWFVDFDPVIDNALAAGNPIPDELEAKAAARQALGDARKPLPEDIRSLFPNAFVFTEEMGWIPEGWEVGNLGKIAEFSNGKSSPDRSDGHIPVFGSNGQIGHCEKSNKENVIIIGRVGTYCGSLYYYSSKCWVTDNAMSAEMKNKEDNFFLFELLKVLSLNDRRTGSGQPLLNQGILKSIKVVIPEITIISKFSRFSSDAYDRVFQIHKESTSLSN